MIFDAEGNGKFSYDFLRCFKTFTGVGDSLMAGFTADGTHQVSSATAVSEKNNWLEYLCSRLNRECNNLAIGSSTAENWRYVNQQDVTGADIENADIPTGCYFLGLGVNDSRRSATVGTADDIESAIADNANSFYGNYDYLVRKMKSFNPYAKIFCILIPSSESNGAAYNTAIEHIASLYDNVYALDLERYVSFATDPIISNGFQSMHYNPTVYNYMSVIIEDTANQYIAEHMSQFKWIPYDY